MTRGSCLLDFPLPINSFLNILHILYYFSSARPESVKFDAAKVLGGGTQGLGEAIL
jgi:hypothetical protein